MQRVSSVFSEYLEGAEKFGVIYSGKTIFCSIKIEF